MIVFRKVFPWLFTRIGPHHKKAGEVLVALLGDSITEGRMSCNYVEMLAGRMGGEGYRFMNAGVSADTAYNVLNRLEPVVKAQPAYVVILVGTNDIQAYLRGGYLPYWYQRRKRVPQAITPGWYVSLLKEMVELVQKRTGAKVGLCSIPILGEDLGSRPNGEVRLFNGLVKALSEELGIGYLPVYEGMEGFLQGQVSGLGKGYEQGTAGRMMVRAAWAHYVGGRSWDDISAGNGLLLTTDTVHFNGRGAGIIADVIEGWLRR
jgi:lysophospholipase L1-like esterase